MQKVATMTAVRTMKTTTTTAIARVRVFNLIVRWMSTMAPWLGESGSGSGMLRILFLSLCRPSAAGMLEVDVLMLY